MASKVLSASSGQVISKTTEVVVKRDAQTGKVSSQYYRIAMDGPHPRGFVFALPYRDFAPSVPVGAVHQNPMLDPYDWGPGGVPKGKPFHYDPAVGFVFEE